MTVANVVCPSCRRSVQPIPVIFGLPDHEGMAMAERGEVAIGGCVVDFIEGPVFECPRCEERFEMVDGQPVRLEDAMRERMASLA